MNLTRRVRWLLGKGYSQKFFENFYSQKDRDAWGYEQSEYARRRYEKLIEMLPEVSTGVVLEVGCAEGHFTRILAQRAKQVAACDISELAIKRAEQNCEGLKNVKLIRADVRGGLPSGEFDVILCSDVLYYLSKTEAVRVIESFAETLRPGAHFLYSNDWQRYYRVLLSPQKVFEIISRSRRWETIKQDVIQGPDHHLFQVGLFRRSNVG